MKPVYLITKDTKYVEDGGLQIIAIYASEEEARMALEDYMKEHDLKDGTHIWYEVTGYRVRNYRCVEGVSDEWFNDPLNYPAMLIRDTEEHLGYIWVDNKEQFIKRHRQGFRLITKAERDMLFCIEL